MLILARHGRTTANAQRLLLGRMDIPLDEFGAVQAAASGTTLAAALAHPTRIVTSPLGRTRATAEAISAACGGVEVVVDDRWIEVDYGVYDGQPLAEVPHEVWQHWRSDPGWRPPEGESLAELGERVRSACEELANDAAEGDVVVVTHVSPIKAAVAWALGMGDEAAWRMFIDVASISRIRTRDNGHPTLVSFNETSHLAGLAT